MGIYSQLLDQALTWRGAAVVLSGVLAGASGWLYVRDILKGGGTKPNTVSYVFWTVLQAIALVAQIKKGGSLSVVFMVLVTLSTTTITILSLKKKYGYRKYGRIEIYCSILTVAAIVGWKVTGDPLLAIFFSIVGDLAATSPTLRKVWLEPRSEHALAWGLMTVASIFGALASDKFDFANLAFPVYLTIVTGVVALLAHCGRNRNPGRKTGSRT